jgi:hypothetical protein
MPLLQVVGTTVVPILYEVDWPEGTSIRLLRADGRDVLRLLPGVADQLVVLGPLLRPLIELHWSRDVARWSGVALDVNRSTALVGVGSAQTGGGWSSTSARAIPVRMAPAMMFQAATHASRTAGVNPSPRPCSSVQSRAVPTTSKCSVRTP